MGPRIGWPDNQPEIAASSVEGQQLYTKPRNRAGVAVDASRGPVGAPVGREEEETGSANTGWTEAATGSAGAATDEATSSAGSEAEETIGSASPGDIARLDGVTKDESTPAWSRRV